MDCGFTSTPLRLVVVFSAGWIMIVVYVSAPPQSVGSMGTGEVLSLWIRNSSSAPQQRAGCMGTAGEFRIANLGGFSVRLR